jgi:hypothetical protein
LTPILVDQYSGILERRRAIIRDPDQWSRFWREARGTNPADLPEVDFSREMVIVAAMGRRSTGGYRITIDSIARSEAGDGLRVVVREVSPGAHRMRSQALTAPIAAVRVARSDDVVTFEERTEIADV